MSAIPATLPSDLKPAQRRCLDLLAAGVRLPRVRDGWGFGDNRVTPATADSLVTRGLVRKQFGKRPQLELTYNGTLLQGVIAGRRERRAGA